MFVRGCLEGGSGSRGPAVWPGSGRPWSGCSESPQERGRRRDRASGAASEHHYAPAKIHVLCYSIILTTSENEIVHTLTLTMSIESEAVCEHVYRSHLVFLLDTQFENGNLYWMDPFCNSLNFLCSYMYIVQHQCTFCSIQFLLSLLTSAKV